MSLTPSDKARAVDRLAKLAKPTAIYDSDYTFGVISSTPNPEDFANPILVFGILHWDETQLGPRPTDLAIETEAEKGPVPESVRSAAMRYVLNDLGHRPAIEAILAQADQNSRDAWEYEISFRRDHPLVATLAGALGLDSEAVDNVFREAIKL